MCNILKNVFTFKSVTYQPDAVDYFFLMLYYQFVATNVENLHLMLNFMMLAAITVQAGQWMIVYEKPNKMNSNFPFLLDQTKKLLKS